MCSCEFDKLILSCRISEALVKKAKDIHDYLVQTLNMPGNRNDPLMKIIENPCEYVTTSIFVTSICHPELPIVFYCENLDVKEYYVKKWKQIENSFVKSHHFDSKVYFLPENELSSDLLTVIPFALELKPSTLERVRNRLHHTIIIQERYLLLEDPISSWIHDNISSYTFTRKQILESSRHACPASRDYSNLKIWLNLYS